MSYQHIDVARIPGLAREMAMDVGACLRFVEDFLRTWEQRQTRVLHAVDNVVIDDALAALLTLSTSSAMIGADRLSAAAKALYSESRALGRVPAGGAEQLGRLGLESCAELEHAVQGWRASLAA